MNKVRSYQILRGSSADELSKYVNDAIKDGWIPNGDLVISKTSYGKMFYQPMVKPE